MAKKRREGSVEEKFEEVRQLVALGRERGYLAIDEINGMLPEEISNSPEDIEEVFSVFEMHGIESLGLLKMDFLGLRNLSTIERALELIERNTGERPDIDAVTRWIET